MNHPRPHISMVQNIYRLQNMPILNELDRLALADLIAGYREQEKKLHDLKTEILYMKHSSPPSYEELPSMGGFGDY